MTGQFNPERQHGPPRPEEMTDEELVQWQAWAVGALAGEVGRRLTMADPQELTTVSAASKALKKGGSSLLPGSPRPANLKGKPIVGRRTGNFERTTVPRPAEQLA